MLDKFSSTLINAGCGAPEYTNKALIKGNDYSLNTTVQYTCEPGYRLEGLATRTCLYPGVWSGQSPVCQGRSARCVYSLMPPVKTSKKKTLCAVPVHNRPVSRPLLSALFLPGVEIFCPLPVTPVNASLTSQKPVKVGSPVGFICNPGNALSGRPVLICNIDGSWDGEPPSCRCKCRTVKSAVCAGQFLAFPAYEVIE